MEGPLLPRLGRFAPEAFAVCAQVYAPHAPRPVGYASSGTIPGMTLTPRARRHLLWLAAWLIAFKAVVPAVAVAASQWRGVDLIEVCTVFGVRTLAVSLDAAHAQSVPADDHGEGLGESTGCGLVGLALAAGPGAQKLDDWALLPQADGSVARQGSQALPPDRVRAWRARLTLAPPTPLI